MPRCPRLDTRQAMPRAAHSEVRSVRCHTHSAAPLQLPLARWPTPNLPTLPPPLHHPRHSLEPSRCQAPYRSPYTTSSCKQNPILSHPNPSLHPPCPRQQRQNKTPKLTHRQKSQLRAQGAATANSSSGMRVWGTRSKSDRPSTDHPAPGHRPEDGGGRARGTSLLAQRGPLHPLECRRDQRGDGPHPA